MTVMAAEAGEGAFEAEGADATAAGRSETRAKTPERYNYRRPENARRLAPGSAGGGSARQGGARRAAGRVAKATPPGREAATVTRALPSGVARNRRVIKQNAQQGASTLTGNYHGAVFGEWILAVILVAGLPFAKPNQTGVSPYAGRDMIQLLAVTLVYFLLAILAATGRTQARFAAWFGALMLLGIGLAETSNITSAVRTWLGGTATTASTATSAAGTTTQTTGNPSVVNAPSTETPTGISRAVAQAPGNGLS